MKIETKFNVGDLIYFIEYKDDKTQKENCPWCGGKGYLICDTAIQQRRQCPLCKGSGKDDCAKQVAFVSSAPVGKINIHLEYSKILIKYGVGCAVWEDTSHADKKAYATYEEAQAVVDSINNKTN